MSKIMSVEKIFHNKSILITGGTGSFGSNFVKRIIDSYKPRRLIIYSRDELKQFELQNSIEDKNNVLRFFIGDVRDKDRLIMAMKGVDICIHAAAMKQVEASEYNPIECIRTNIHGAENIIESSLINKVEYVIALSTDKAANPINLYGATKLCSDKLFINANAYIGSDTSTKFSIVRYGNVINSRGSVVPFFKKILLDGKKVLPLTHRKMTRFWINITDGVDFVCDTLTRMKGGEIFIPKIPSIRILDLIHSFGDDITFKEIGIRPGERLNEILCPQDLSPYTIEFQNFFSIFPSSKHFKNINYLNINGEDGKKVDEHFEYTSDNNSNFLSISQIKESIKFD